MIMAKIIRSTDSLTEPPLTTASRRSLPPRGRRIIKNDSLTELPLTTALTGRASPQGEACFEGEKIFCGKFCKSPRKTLAILFRIWYSI